MTPELDMGDNLGKTVKDDTLRGLKAERQTGGKGEGMIWIWVKCGGNSRWLVQDDFRRGYVGLGLVEKEMSVSGVLLYHPACDEKGFRNPKVRVGKLFLFGQTC